MKYPFNDCCYKKDLKEGLLNNNKEIEKSMKNNHTSKAPIFEISSEIYYCDQIQDLKNNNNNNSISKSLSDNRWNLIVGIQSSYVGQFLKYLEILSSLNSFNVTSTSTSIHNNNNNNSNNNWKNSAAAWESIFRIKWNDISIWTQIKQLPCLRQVPLVIRPILETFQNDNNNNKLHSRLARLYRIAEEFPGIVSEWQLFSVFIEEACEQVMILICIIILLLLSFLF